MLDFKRKKQEEKIASESRPVPKISQKSKEITKNSKGHHKFGSIERFRAIDEEQRENRKKFEEIRQSLEMKDFTGKPQINKKSKEMFKSITDTIKFEEQQAYNKEERLKNLVKKLHN